MCACGGGTGQFQVSFLKAFYFSSLFLCVWVCYLHGCMLPYICLVPVKVRRGCQILRTGAMDVCEPQVGCGNLCKSSHLRFWDRCSHSHWLDWPTNLRGLFASLSLSLGSQVHTTKLAGLSYVVAGDRTQAFVSGHSYRICRASFPLGAF